MSGQLIDDAAERAVLGGIIVHNPAFDEIADQLEPEDFGKEHHAQIFIAIRALHLKATAIDFVTLKDELHRAGQLEHVGGPAYIASLFDGVPRTTNVKYYAAIIRNKALQRRVRDTLRRLVGEAEGAEMSGVELLEQAESAIYALGSQSVKSEWLSGQDLALGIMPVLERLFDEKKAVTGVPSGFADLDAMTHGFQKSDLILLGARPSQGKTAFGMQVAEVAAKEAPVAFFSIEMSRDAQTLRRVIQKSGIDGWRVMSGRVTDVEMRRIGEVVGQIGESRIWMDESAYLSPLHVRTRLRRLIAKTGPIGLVVIDYLQLMAALPEDKRENKTNQVAGVSRMLKLLAREFGAPFLVLSQLNRNVKDGSRPSMSDLRDSGALEQDADVVLLLHRPEVYDATPDNAGLAELILAKQRQGPTGTVRLTWLRETMRFMNQAPL